MKKTLFKQLAALVLAGFTTSTIYAQDQAGDLSLNRTKDPIASNKVLLTDAAPVPSTSIPGSEVNSKALRHFNKFYKEIDNATWDKADAGYVATFRNNGIKTSIYYTKNGGMECSISNYTEDKLPDNVRHLVRSNFYDYSISTVTEVNKSGITAYLVRIEDNCSFKTVKVIGNEWEVFEEFSKR